MDRCGSEELHFSLLSYVGSFWHGSSRVFKNEHKYELFSVIALSPVKLYGYTMNGCGCQLTQSDCEQKSKNRV